MKTHIGFTLLEVLIAMLILAIGLLGLAALQTYTLRSNLAAYNHGQGVQLLYDMSDRMRANSCKANPNSTPPVTCPYASNYVITNSNTDPTGSPSSRTLNKTVVSTPTPVSPMSLADAAVCRTVGNITCIPTLLSTYDLIEWNTALAATLPMGRGCIASTTVAGVTVFNLYVTWDDNRDGAVTTDITVPTGCASTFSTYAAPVTGVFHDPIFTMSLQL